MTTARARRVLTLGAVSALVALALMMWSMADSRPIPIVIAMSAGQGLGTLSLLLYLAVVVSELRRTRLVGGGRRGSEPKDGQG